MTQFLILYALAGLITVLGLTYMLYVVGQVLADCPRSGRAAAAGALTIGTAFVAIALGAMSLGVIPMLDRGAGPSEVFGTLGTLLIGLGIGFTYAVAQLRRVVLDAVAAVAASLAAPVDEAEREAEPVATDPAPLPA